MGRNILKIIAVGALLGLVACGDKDKNEVSGGTVAIVPYDSADCLNYGPNSLNQLGTQSCNSQYNQLGGGFTNIGLQNNQYFGQQNGYLNGFCGCGSGTRPTYNANWGLGCVQQNAFSQNSAVYYQYNPQTASMTQANLNINQTPSYFNGQTCYQTLTYACDARNPETSCGANYYCQAQGASAVGICIVKNSNWKPQRRYPQSDQPRQRRERREDRRDDRTPDWQHK